MVAGEIGRQLADLLLPSYRTAPDERCCIRRHGFVGHQLVCPVQHVAMASLRGVEFCCHLVRLRDNRFRRDEPVEEPFSIITFLLGCLLSWWLARFATSRESKSVFHHVQRGEEVPTD